MRARSVWLVAALVLLPVAIAAVVMAGPVIGVGWGQLGLVYQHLDTWYEDSFVTPEYWLQDTSRRQINNIHQHNGSMNPSAVIRTEFYNSAGDVVWWAHDNNWTDPVEWIASDAHANMAKTYDFLLSQLGVNSHDDAGGSMVSVTHTPSGAFGGEIDNSAGWVGGSVSKLYFGDITDFRFRHFSAALDVVGHEFAHGFTQRYSQLVYEREPGALNEAFSDWLGIVLKRASTGRLVWTFGEETSTTYTPFRSLAAPPTYGHPDTYQGVNWVDPSSVCNFDNDYCGVHTNSGVPNKMFYLLAEGGTKVFNGVQVTGIGEIAAARIAVRANRVHWGSQASFLSARSGMFVAARELYGAGSNEEAQVQNAWAAVGVGAPAPAGPYTITVTPSNASLGTVTGGGTFPAGSIRTITATPNCGVQFQGWYDGTFVSSSPSYTFTLNANRSFVAIFGLVANCTPPGSFNKTAPANGATGQPAGPNLVTLTWSTSTGATAYQFCVDTTNDGACSNWTTVTQPLGLQVSYGTTYYWQVRATNAFGTTYANGGPSAMWSFTTQPAADSYEVDNTSAQSSLLTLGVPQAHTLHTVGDVDWARFTATAGRRFILSTNAGVDTEMYLWGPNGLLAYDDNGGGFPHSRIVYTPTVTGTYYAQVQGRNAFLTGSYQLSLHSPAPKELLFLNNGDNASDVFAYHGSSGVWARLLTMSNGGFLESTGAWNPAWSIQPANFNTDGLTDLFLYNTTTGRWFKMLNTGSDFTVQATDFWRAGWQQRFVMDLDGDGISDLFLYDPNTGVWYKAISTPSGFNYFSSSWLPGWEITPVNLNGDAYGDLFLYSRTDGRWFWVLGQSGGDFSYPQTSSWLNTWRITPGDFNGDGLSDLLLLDPASGRYFTCINNGAGFIYFSDYWIPGWSPTVADLNGDGADDLFLYNNSTGRWYVVLSNKLGQFIDAASGGWNPGWTIHPTDFNGDGWTDLLLYDPTTGRWFQAWTYNVGVFTYVGGYWLPGLTIVVGAPPR